MNGSIPALTALGNSLKTVVDSGDAARFREYLEGGPLPALGGDLEPAEIIRRALVQIGAAPELTRETARLLAAVVSKEVEMIRAGQQLTPDHKDLLLDCLHLAVDLPTNEQLFQSLKHLLDLPKEFVRGAEKDLWFSLFRALGHQQTDASLESRWLAILESTAVALTPALKTWLLTAWRGLLWIPPEEEKRRVGEIVDFDRVERGLLALEATIRDQEGGARLLKLALDILSETYPRSTEYWIHHFQSRAARWPKVLQEVILEKWPLRKQRADEPVWRPMTEALLPTTGLVRFAKSVGRELKVGDDLDQMKLPQCMPQQPVHSQSPLQTSAQQVTEMYERRKAAALVTLVTQMGFRMLNLGIRVDNDKATITGQVGSQEEREKIVLLVGNTEGIGSVDDQLKVERPEPEAEFYEVKSGDSLSKIAKQFYGDANKYNVIFEANRPMLKDPDELYPGLKLRVPAASRVTSVRRT